jgi:hypothetical protein
MKVDTSTPGQSTTTLCGGKLCCPQITERADGTASIHEDGVAVAFTKDQLDELEEYMVARRARRSAT